MTYYDELEVSPTASPEVIRMAYRALARKYRPDVYKGNQVFAQEKMTRINEAYSVLSSAVQRQEYDKTLYPQKQRTEQYSQTQQSGSAQQPSATLKSQSAQQPDTAPRTNRNTENATIQKKNSLIHRIITLFYMALAVLLGVLAFYIEDVTMVVVGFFCIAQCIYYPYWFKSEKRIKNKLLATMCFAVSNFVLITSFWSIMFTNNLFWYGQHKENSHIEMNINTSAVEKTSFLYLINQFNPESSIEDVIKIMGTNYKVPDYGGYVMEYSAPQYSLNGCNSTFISFEFNSRKTKILSIKWAYREPTLSQFSYTLEYLQDHALGIPQNISSNKADWTGLHLEDTGYFLLFIRKF